MLPLWQEAVISAWATWRMRNVALGIINRGDSFRRRRSRSNSLGSGQPHARPQRCRAGLGGNTGGAAARALGSGYNGGGSSSNGFGHGQNAQENHQPGGVLSRGDAWIGGRGQAGPGLTVPHLGLHQRLRWTRSVVSRSITQSKSKLSERYPLQSAMRANRTSPSS
ncbi:GL11332 [Drosophila persimilis]|uniref:GL11332 n=1 Tax=Drosophila persimilis TaxID=7234 RepID=B4GA76_DROPE|nr:GL11332 [Drosophila persimilis]